MPDAPLQAASPAEAAPLPRWLVRLLAGLAVAMWLLVLVAAWNVFTAGAQARRLAAEGVEGVSVVTDLRLSGRRNRARDTNAGLGQATYTVVHRLASQARPDLLRTDVSFPFFSGLAIGSRIPIRYVPADPSIHELERGSFDQDRILGWAGVALFGLVAVALTIAVARQQLLRPRRRGPASSG